jgi:hypothetical protein
MNKGEYRVFDAALSVTRQPKPGGLVPQVALGQIVRTDAAFEWHAKEAHKAINSKRCDLLIANRYGDPVAVVEYQGGGHDKGGTAAKRDGIKRIVLEKAGIRVVEIQDGTQSYAIENAIRDILTRQQSGIPGSQQAPVWNSGAGAFREERPF